MNAGWDITLQLKKQLGENTCNTCPRGLHTLQFTIHTSLSTGSLVPFFVHSSYFIMHTSQITLLLSTSIRAP